MEENAENVVEETTQTTEQPVEETKKPNINEDGDYVVDLNKPPKPKNILCVPFEYSVAPLSAVKSSTMIFATKKRSVSPLSVCQCCSILFGRFKFPFILIRNFLLPKYSHAIGRNIGSSCC